MTKIAYNNCYGGFRLSYDAVKAYAKRKGIELYCGARPEGVYDLSVPMEECSRERAMTRMSMHSWFKSPDYNWDSHFSDRDIPRNDPDLIAVIEELGPAASGAFAKLAIAEVAPGARFRIDEYDGNESVMTADDYEWQTA